MSMYGMVQQLDEVQRTMHPRKDNPDLCICRPDDDDGRTMRRLIRVSVDILAFQRGGGVVQGWQTRLKALMVG